jgi:hypothetical protein
LFSKENIIKDTKYLMQNPNRTEEELKYFKDSLDFIEYANIGDVFDCVLICVNINETQIEELKKQEVIFKI